MSSDVQPSAALNESEPLDGREFHGCRIEAEVGRGGMGVVYRAEQVALGRKVALKLVAPALARDEAFRRRFERESQMAAAIDHPHAIPVYEAGEDGGQLFILMRYVAGADLASLLASEGALEPARVARIVAQVGSALDAAHGTGLVHRDVKPANILLSGEGSDEHAYLSDFGLTKDAASASALTHTGQWVGTLDYVAPEQLEGKPVDARTDVYALGCLLYEALSGAVPYGGSDVAKMWGHAHSAPPSFAGLDPARAAFAPVVARALAKAPEDRFPSSGDLGRAAAAAAAGTTSPVRERSVATGAAAPGKGLLEKPFSPGAPSPLPPSRRAPSSGQGRAGPTIARTPAREWGWGRTIASVAAGLLLLLLTAGAVVLGAWLAREGAPAKAEATPEAPSGGPADAKASSAEPETVIVPSVQGGSASAAKADLKRSGLEVTITRRFSERPLGQIVEQRPAARQRVPLRATITLFVSKGPEQLPLTAETPLTTNSFGRVTVGMTEEEAEEATGDELVPQGSYSNTGECTYRVVEGLPGVSIMISDGEIARFDVTEEGTATKSGITVGSSEGMVNRAYGGQVEEREHRYDPRGSYLTFVPENASDRTRVVFETSDREVTYIRAGRLPEVDLIEGCS